MDVQLEVVEGRRQGAVVPVKVSPFVIGRDPGCQLRPKSPTTSGRHSAIHLRDDRVVVEDLGSTNGTLVNDQCLRAGEEMSVVDGDRLQVGPLIFVVRIASEVPEVEAAPHGWLAWELDPEHEVLCVGLSRGRLNEEGVGELRRAMCALAANPDHRRAVLDLADVDSLPIGTYPLLLTLVQRWREAGSELRLCSLSADVRRMAVTLKLDQAIERYDDRAEAVSAPWE